MDYNELLERIVKGAEYLENPLITQKDYERGIKRYDSLVEQFMKMKEGMGKC